MDRRAFLVGAAALLAAPLVAEAQQTGSGSTPRPGGRLPRVGYLGSGHPADRSSRLFSYLFEAFANGLREGGYVDGQTVTVEYRFAEERFERLPDLAGELVRLGVDVIFATADHTAAAARQATPTIPIVFNSVTDPVAMRFAASLSHPGGNMTGLTQPGPQLTGKRLSFLKEAIAKLSVAVLRNPTGTAHLLHLPAVQKAAQTLRLQVQVFDASNPQDFERVFGAIANDRAQAVLLLPDSTFYIRREQLAELALRYRLPMSGFRAEFARAGVLMAYGSVLSAEWRRAGVLVGKILNGGKPSDIPVEEPTVRVCHQLKSEGARPHDPAVPVGAGGSGDPVMDARVPCWCCAPCRAARRRGTAGGNLADRLLGKQLTFPSSPESLGGIPAGVTRTRLPGRKGHRIRVPIWRGET
jgi:putative ABC transport system substrate-binding protein